jgi:hypothetical protein
MKISRLGMLVTVTGALALVSMILQAATGPSWWVARGVLNTNVVPNDFAAINQGQLKWIATNAAAELEAQLPGGAGSAVWALIGTLRACPEIGFVSREPARGCARSDRFPEGREQARGIYNQQVKMNFRTHSKQQ